MVLIPIRIFSGSLGGATIYQNPSFVSPNLERSELKRGQGDRYKERVQQKDKRKKLEESLTLAPDPLSNKAVFK
jgi:ribosome biogenesis protein BRX1